MITLCSIAQVSLHVGLAIGLAGGISPAFVGKYSSICANK